jgi:hypothetical protein
VHPLYLAKDTTMCVSFYNKLGEEVWFDAKQITHLAFLIKSAGTANVITALVDHLGEETSKWIADMMNDGDIGDQS